MTKHTVYLKTGTDRPIEKKAWEALKEKFESTDIERILAEREKRCE